MQLSDLVYQTIKGCTWLNRELSKADLINTEKYQNDIDIGTFVNNVFVALNDGFNFASGLNKFFPIIEKFENGEELDMPLPDTVLNVYQEDSTNGYLNIDFTTSSLNEVLLLEDKVHEDEPIYVEYIRGLPYLEWSIFKTTDDFELLDYGISDQLAYAVISYAQSLLWMDIDANLGYLRQNVATSRISNLPDFGNKVLHNQRDVALWEGI